MEEKESQFVITEKDLAPFVHEKYVSIKWRFIFYFFLISLAPLLIVSFSLIQKSQFELKNLIQSKFESIAILKASQLGYWMNDNKKEFKNIFNARDNLFILINQMITDKSPQSRDALRSSLIQLKGSTEHFLEFFLIDPESGKIVVSTNQASEGLLQTDADYFIKGKDGFFESTVYYSETLKDNALTMSMPVKDSDDKLMTVFAGHVNLNMLYNFLSERIGLGKTGETYMVSRFYKSIPAVGLTAENTIDDKRGFKDIKIAIKEKPVYTEGVIKALKGEKGVNIYKNYNNIDVIGYFQFFPEFGLVFLVEQYTDEVFDPISSMGRTLFLIFLLVLFADAVIAFITSNSISKPIKILTDNARRVQSGDLEVISDIETNDEFGILAKALNNMSESLILSLGETKNIINIMPNALFILGVDGTIKSANQSAIDLTEFKGEKLIGTNFKNLIRYPDYTENKPNTFDLNQIAKEGKINDIQLYCFTNSHRAIPINLSGAVLKDKNKKLIGFIIIVQDLRRIKEYAKKRLQIITPLLQKISLGDFTQKFDVPQEEDEFTDLLISLDLMADNLHILMKENQLKTSQIKKSKEKTEEERAKAEALLGSIGEGIIAIDLQGKTMLMNPEAENVFQKKFKDVFGKNCCEELHFEDEKGKRIYPDSFPISEVATKKKQIHTITYFVKENGDKLPLSTTVSPILFDNKMLGVIGTFRDITKEMEVDRAKSEFVSLASHQLRTPLAGINWLLQEIQRKGNMDDLQKEYLHDAMQSNERMVRLVNDLLNVSRLETGIINVNYSEVNLPDFVEEFVKEASFVAKNKNQKIEYKKPAKQIMITLDRDLIGQVISNLLSNAINYTDKDKTIHVSLNVNNDGASIIVKDEGIGISKDDQAKIFTKFFRSRNAAKYSTTGSGLGLYIVKKILDICCGKIQCSSEEGKGASFIITLPLSCKVAEKEGKKIVKSPIT